MMNPKFNCITSATALVLTLAIGQMCLPVSLAASAGAAIASPQQASAILTTTNNKPITVNGAEAISGATIMTGAAVETPDQVGASINMPGLFTLEIAPRAKVSLEFDRNSIKVNLTQGCVVLLTKKGTSGEIVTSKGVVAKSDGSKDARLEACDPSISRAPAAAGGGNTARNIAIIAGAALLLIPVVKRGDNPSPPTPTP